MQGQINVFYTSKTKWLKFFFFMISCKTREIWGLVITKKGQQHFKATKASNPQSCKKDQSTAEVLHKLNPRLYLFGIKVI